MKDSQNQSEEKLLAEIERLKKEIKKKKKYGLVWEEKTEDVVELCKEKLPVLKEVQSKELITDKDKPVNLLIEGDNYHALSVLNYTHAKKVDVIYIDPPYNTGNKDFIFNDRFVDREDAYRHSKWLAFMEKRLKLAKNLLKDTGVIFISIDDNEVAQLKLLMDNPDLLGEKNLIANFIWQHRKSSQNDIDVSLSHNYILCYAKKRTKTNLVPLPIDDSKFSNPDNDPRGDWVADPMDAPGIRENLMYKIVNPNTGVKFLPPKGRHWRFTKEKFEKAMKNNRIIFGKTGKSKPQYKRFKTEAEERGVNVFTIWDDVGTATEATKEMFDILGRDKKFETPKPISLMEKILAISTYKNSVILDFFAGSGSTGHAILELNKRDGGNRQFILCTNNQDENGGHKICWTHWGSHWGSHCTLGVKS